MAKQPLEVGPDAKETPVPEWAEHVTIENWQLSQSGYAAFNGLADANDTPINYGVHNFTIPDGARTLSVLWPAHSTLLLEWFPHDAAEAHNDSDSDASGSDVAASPLDDKAPDGTKTN